MAHGRKLTWQRSNEGSQALCHMFPLNEYIYISITLLRLNLAVCIAHNQNKNRAMEKKVSCQKIPPQMGVHAGHSTYVCTHPPLENNIVEMFNCNLSLRIVIIQPVTLNLRVRYVAHVKQQCFSKSILSFQMLLYCSSHQPQPRMAGVVVRQHSGTETYEVAL